MGLEMHIEVQWGGASHKDLTLLASTLKTSLGSVNNY